MRTIPMENIISNEKIASLKIGETVFDFKQFTWKQILAFMEAEELENETKQWSALAKIAFSLLEDNVLNHKEEFLDILHRAHIWWVLEIIQELFQSTPDLIENQSKAADQSS